jgi:hypothetical protein
MKTNTSDYPRTLPSAAAHRLRTQARAGVWRTESQSVELGDADSVYVAIQTGASKLNVSGDVRKINLDVE